MSKLKLKDENDQWLDTAANGYGIPSGGSKGDVFVKSSSTDYATQWENAEDLLIANQKEISTGINRLSAIKIGKIVVLYALENGPAIPTAGINLPSSLYPKANSVSGTGAHFYSNAWHTGWVYISNAGKITAYDGNTVVNASYSRFTAVYELANP